MNGVNKWKMNRAGLVNFWYYADETFQFGDGKLLLRGSNGSGKSVTMQSFLPVLLDGKKSPDRLDPFGSKARKMEDYLLGEKEITGRDERTGYLFLEYKRKETDQYVTTGIGLRAKRHKNMDFWGFVITDNRRVGHDLFLYKEERVGANTEKIPLTKKELETKIGDGGRIVSTQKEYMELVNKYIFGFETLEAYDELIKLLIQLRSPKLSKDFKPTVIYGILENSLPELSDDELRPLSDTIENMDQTKQQLEQLERDEQALDRLCSQYDMYNEYMLGEKAAEYVKAHKALETKKAEEITLKENIKDYQQKLHDCLKEEKKLKQEKEVHIESKRQLEKHEVFDMEQEKRDTEKKLADRSDDARKKELAIEGKEQKERQLKESIRQQKDEQYEHERKINDLLEEMETDSGDASFASHAINAEDFKRHLERDFDFSVWKKEAEIYEIHLKDIVSKWEEFNREKQRFEDANRDLGEAQKRLDQTRDDERKWASYVEEEKNTLQEAIIHWLKQYDFFDMDEDVLQQTAHRIQDLYESYSYEEMRRPFLEKYENLKEAYESKKRDRAHQLKLLDIEIEDKKRELESWKQLKDPEPERHAETNEARKELVAKGIAFIPLYRAVEFRDSVTEEERERLESALQAAGILDSLIVSKQDEHLIPKCDKILKANPLEKTDQTLANWLIPDLPEGSPIMKDDIQKVLASICVNVESTEGKVSIYSDGRFEIGLLQGHAPKTEVQYIGSQARERFRKEKIRHIEQMIKQLQEKRAEIDQVYNECNQFLEKLEQSFRQFPKDSDVKTAYDNLQHVRHRLKHDDELVQEKDERVKELFRDWEKIRYQLNELTKEMNIESTKDAYVSAIFSMQSYMKQLNSLQVTFAKYESNRKHIFSQESNLEEITEDIDSLKGELNVIIHSMEKEQFKLSELNKRLEELGAKDIRRQIQEVTEKLDWIEERLPELQKLAVKYEKDGEIAQERYKNVIQELHHVEKLLNLSEELFLDEVRLYYVVEEESEIDDSLELARKIERKFQELLKKETRSSVHEKLAKSFYKEQQTLVEYRLTEELHEKDIKVEEREPITEELAYKWNAIKEKARRTILLMEFKGKRVSPYYVLKAIKHDISTQREVLNETDRELYEEIILNSVGRILRGRIHRAERWVKKINDLMEMRDTSSGLTFSIRWRPKTAESEDEMDTKDLVDLLRSDPRLLKEEDMKRVTNHFRSKISRAKELSLAEGYGTTLHQVIKEILDYRKWFQFTLYYKRENENKRELTNHVFFTFSGGEKAMAMYIPLFSAAYSRYQEAKADAPYIISLDEAFAGVDENNIRDMFELVEQLGFNYIMNSQAIWGDYDTVSNLSIAELVRPKKRSICNGDSLSLERFKEEAFT
ncbi:TIGR02680 family protein [Bacillus sp. FJAT-47783]|uniref:TIGR02680 family protein n=1 Tax=Bacillus sp. FJAT-47783 TaxID=2922712 RepID=UPI001FAE2DE3|nr:TIGR02680 family protein [Bacillus sp. FJAT-47783]